MLGVLALFLAPAAFGAAPPGAAAPGAAKAKAGGPKPAAPYTTAHARPLEPSEKAVREADDHTQSRVEFNGIKGDRVPAYLYVPRRKAAAAKAPFPAVLLQYGTGGHKGTGYIVAIARQFVGRGYVVLTIDSPGCGERKDKGKKSAGVLSRLSPEQVMHYCGDYSRAVDFLAGRPEVNRERLGYVGISWGAITGITYVAYDPRVKAMASLVGGGNFFGAYSAKSAARAAAEGSKSSDPVYHVARVAPRPLLLLNATKDQLILRFWAESLHRAAGAGSKVVWLNTDHYFKGLDRTVVCGSVIEFMDKALALGRLSPAAPGSAGPRR
jgi:dienelactone hydrolase